jgi:hypothetical protein
MNFFECNSQDKETEKILKMELFKGKNGISPGPDACNHLNYNYSKARKCLSNYFTHIIENNFKAEKFTYHPAGKYKIKVNFIIDSKGKIRDIKAEAPYQDMEKEAIRTIKRIPRMNPGKLNGKKVSVYYWLPIIFIVPG